MELDDIILLDKSFKIAVKLMEEFDDVFVTSCGIRIWKDDSDVVVTPDAGLVLYNACYAMRLPVTWMKQKAAFYNDVKPYRILRNRVKPQYVGCFEGLDWKRARELDDVLRKKPSRDRVFLSDDGRMFSDIILYNN